MDKYLLKNLPYEELLKRVEEQNREIERLKGVIQSNDDRIYFKNLTRANEKVKKKALKRENYKNTLKYNALEYRKFLNAPIDVYENTKNEARRDYERRLRQISDQKLFKSELGNLMKNASNEISFETDIGRSDIKRYAFTEMLRHLYRSNTNSKVVVLAHTLDNKKKWFTLSDKQNIESTIGHISGELDLTTDQSDTNPYITNAFIPVRYELVFLNKSQTKDGVKFHIKKQDPDSNKVFDEDVEIDDDYRATPEGSFFPYVNLSDIDLSSFQIFKTIERKNYRDNCFVFACIQSGVFSDDEITHLRFFVQTRSIPNNKIIEIAKAFQCNFAVRRIDEKLDPRHQQQIKIDTRKLPWAKGFTRFVDLLLYKDHYMLYQKVPATVYYLEHAQELKKKFPDLPQQKLQLIMSNNKFSNEGTLPMAIFRKMFDLNLFREIKSCELNILNTTEYDNLNDYDTLEYNENLCTKLIDSNDDKKKEKKWTRIYYSDFETDVTVSPHQPYLNCTVYRDGPNIHKISFTGENIGQQLLDYLCKGSLTYFHNLKYDSCFFINTPGWHTEITERSGTVLQIIMIKYKIEKGHRIISKQLVFRNSYSIIPSALRNFASMFNLNVHKEVMAYKIYTRENIERKVLPISDFFNQYRIENEDRLSKEELISDAKQILENAKEAGAYDNGNIDIMKYAIYYCRKDCIVLMKGLEKFDMDLKQVFNETHTKMMDVNNFISISSIGYYFAHMFGCFDGCYMLSGKPQNFIQRCVSGGRTMTANNEKQYVEGKIQDFDAVSLYPSAMYVMPGVPKGVPQVIPDGTTHEELMNYDTFFIEINIRKIQCKSETPYKFGQVFRRNSVGSKVFDNNPVEHFYIDKVGLMDLIEFYDIEYDLIRGYYFDKGFNTKINQFIEGLFNLRLRYKKEKNPLQSTIKLLLNSIYGKSILKAMKTETKSVPRDQLFKYIWRNYNFITEVVDEPTIEKCYVKRLKPIIDHFNLPQFGASVLSWSKHLMNRVMASAEQHGVPIFYQDTDSMHIFEKDVPKIADIFKFNYHSDLIGEKMCQFHNDFDGFPGAIGKIHSRKLIALGKKSYLDILVDEKGNEGYHIRLKGIPHQVILNKCKRMDITVEELYERLYRGESFTFDLLDGTNAFRKTKSFQQTNLPKFNRCVKFT